MSDLFTTLERPDHRAALAIAGQLGGAAPIKRLDLNAAMNDAFGGTDAAGYWSQRDSFEVLEHALALHLAGRPYPLAALADVAQATTLMERLPTQTVRSEDQISLQQFSTPADIAALAVLLASIGADDIVLEPSAGNGLLVAQAPACAVLQLNELDPTRRGRLASIFPSATITGVDGAALVAHHASLPRPSVVLMNPPFSRSLGRGADDLAAARHLHPFATTCCRSATKPFPRLLRSRPKSASTCRTVRAVSCSTRPANTRPRSWSRSPWARSRRRSRRMYRACPNAPLQSACCPRRSWRPSSTPAMKAGQSVVLQLVTTAEAILDRRLSQMSAEERAEAEIDLSPTEYIVDYLKRAFPTRQMQVYTDDTGTARSARMGDEDGNPVHNPEAIAARDRMIENICALPPVKSALDAIIEHFGANAVSAASATAKVRAAYMP